MREMDLGVVDPVLEVKERLFPLSPFTRFLEWLVERLPRKRVSFALAPNVNIAEIDGRAGEFKAVAEKPSFAVELLPNVAQGGWFYMEAALVRHTGDRETLLFGKWGSGAQGDFEIPIPSNLRGTVREVFFLPGPVTELSWAPMRAPGYFSQSSLLVHRISAAESFLRRTHRVLLTLWSMRGNSSNALADLSWWGAVHDLHQAYLQTARLQIQRYRGHDYAQFVARHDAVSQAETNALQRQLGKLQNPPSICLLMCVGDAESAWLGETLASIAGQTYRHWELVVKIGSALPSECQKVLQVAQMKDQRIRIMDCLNDADLAFSLNALLASTTLGYVGVIHQHDVLPPHALLWMAAEVNRHPDAAVIYSDHDCIDANGKRHDPLFKPDWNPDFFTAYDYMANLRLWNVDMVRALGGFRPGFDGAELYELTLRCIKICKPEHIFHIPRVLYHRRQLAPVEVNNASAAPDREAHVSGLRALSQHFEEAGAIVHAGAAHGLYRIRHPIPGDGPLVSIIIPTRDKVEVLKACIESIQHRTDYLQWEILIVDNCSQEPQTIEWLKHIQTDARIRVIAYGDAFNYSAINNFAVEHARGSVLVLLNNDIEVINSNWLSEMVSHVIRPHVGAVGAKLLYPNGMVQHAGVVLGIGGVAGHVHRYLGGSDPGYNFRAIATQNYSVVTAACLAVRRDVYLEVGGLDAVNLKVAFNDVDFCLKLVKAGYRNVFTPYALLYHHESLSRGHDDTPLKKAIFEQEFGYMKTFWGKVVDPAYNPNLSLEFEDFSLRRS